MHVTESEGLTEVRLNVTSVRHSNTQTHFKVHLCKKREREEWGGKSLNHKYHCLSIFD